MNHFDLSANIDGIFVGAVKDCWEGKPPSAIQKDRVDGRQLITSLGFSEDAQADLTVHGGEDKAIHHYAFDHYSAWQAEGLIAPGTLPVAFGENISTTGLTEENLCIGDILSLGTAVVQISQGRQPCWKLGLHTGHKEMPYQFQKTGRTGWYYRVLEPGEVGSGDRITLVERLNPNWSVLAVTRARLTRRILPEDAEVLSQMKELAQSWRQAFCRMAEGNAIEYTSARLGA
ncbi:MOSC domain-containing protein [Ruegeria faecimaris]|uniref:MOSC domain-containing protein n=1 Tax=Ruegeria faecimaris TaxID=686389 RepID=UPI00249065F2|nr:MOSC domain-containing protein [Ruegeria faecimaris]